MNFELKYLKYKKKYIAIKTNKVDSDIINKVGSDIINKVGGGNTAPLYVTIGPQNSGKTTFLKTVSNLIDVAIDDDPEVYRHLPLDVLDNINNKKYDVSEYRFHDLDLRNRMKQDGRNERTKYKTMFYISYLLYIKNINI